MENSFDNHTLIDVSMGMSFSIRRMSFIYNMKNVTALPLTFLYTHDSSFFMKSNDLIASLECSNFEMLA